ncbi:MAG: phosphoribosylformylglycinamidine cyclo-ligase [Chloroflexota bacterium]
MSLQYLDAGVDLEEAGRLTQRITQRLGSALFGGFVPVSEIKSYEEPVLVSSIDGIGTKVHLAGRLHMVDGLGRDIVHHCVNDIAVHGARPLFFLDYLALNKLEPDLVERIVAGIAGACQALDIRLAGGETAEMPLVYPSGHFDIAGAVVGVVEQRDMVDGSAIRGGDVLLGLPSSGLHTNGYSLVPTIFSDDDLCRYEPDFGATLAEALLEPHRCYVTEMQLMVSTGLVHGMAHITGGGIAGNLARIMPSGLQAVVHLDPPSGLFRLIDERSGMAREEMRRIFNMGIGLIAVCDSSTPIPAGCRRLGVVQPAEASEARVVFSDND